MAAQIEKNAILWSLVSWGAGIVGALIVGFLVAKLFGEVAAGIIFGGVTFVILAWVLSRYLGPPAEDDMPLAPAVPHAAPHAAPTAPARAPGPPPVAAPVAPSEVPDAASGGISERVREAARAAGEAARAAFGDMKADAGAPVPPTSAEQAPQPVRPARLDGPRDGGADDLKKIKGVGPKIEELLHSLGFYHFDQIAAWTPAEIAWVDANLDGFNGRATRDDWVGQSKTLAAGGETEFSQRVDKGEVY